MTNAVCLDDLDLVYHPFSFSLSLVLANKPLYVHKSLKGFFNRSDLLKFQDNSWIEDEGLDLNSLNNFDYYLLRNDNKYAGFCEPAFGDLFRNPFFLISPSPILHLVKFGCFTYQKKKKERKSMVIENDRKQDFCDKVLSIKGSKIGGNWM